MADGFLNKLLNFVGLSDNEDDDEEDTYLEDEPVPQRTAKVSFRTKKDQEPEDEEDYLPGPAKGKANAQQNAAQHRPASQQASRQAPAQTGSAMTNGMKMIVYHPVSYEDTRNIIDNIKKRKPVIVNMEELEIETAQRILDFISGAVYALEGTMNKISRGIFVVAPSNCDVVASAEDEYMDM